MNGGLNKVDQIERDCFYPNKNLLRETGNE